MSESGLFRSLVALLLVKVAFAQESAKTATLRFSPAAAGLLQQEPEKCRVVNYSERQNCGFPRITRRACEARGCCFDSGQKLFSWCFYPNGYFQVSSNDRKRFSGFTIIAKPFTPSLSDPYSADFHSLAALVEWELLKGLRYRIPCVERVTATNFAPSNECVRADYELRVVKCNFSASIEDLQKSFVDAWRKQMIGIVNYTLFKSLSKIADYNECDEADGTDPCQQTQADCTNTVGSYECLCRQGYFADGNGNCVDVDECSNNAHNCTNKDMCTNQPGSYECKCPSGYTSNSFQECVDIDECSMEEICANVTFCKNSKEVNNSCQATVRCNNSPGSFTCQCAVGFNISPIGEEPMCKDIDECAEGFHQCHVSSKCKNSFGSYSCVCSSGFVQSNATSECLDVNECANSDLCHSNAQCANQPGFFTCTCSFGFEGDGVKECNPVKLCSDREPCDLDSECVYAGELSYCICKLGYKFEDLSCVDINECEEGFDYCHSNAFCYNTNGSYECVCQMGFMGDGKTKCDPIGGLNTNVTTECDPLYGSVVKYNENRDDSSNRCSYDAACLLRDGDFICECDSGFLGDGVLCKDVNECSADLHACHVFATCNNTPGDYECTCKPGFTGNGYECNDLNECRDGQSYGCQNNAICVNNYGSYRCVCGVAFQQSDDDKCIERQILVGTIQVFGPVARMCLHESLPPRIVRTIYDFISSQLERLYVASTSLDADVELLELRGGKFVKHVIVLTGRGAHNLTTTSFNASVIETLQNPMLSTQLLVTFSYLLSVKELVADDWDNVFEKLERTSELVVSLTKQQKTLKEKVALATVTARISINPVVVNNFVTEDQQLLNSSSLQALSFAAKLERDLYSAYSYNLLNVQKVEVFKILPHRKNDVGNITRMSLSDVNAAVFKASINFSPMRSSWENNSLDYASLTAIVEVELRRRYEFVLRELLDQFNDYSYGRVDNQDERKDGSDKYRANEISNVNRDTAVDPETNGRFQGAEKESGEGDDVAALSDQQIIKVFVKEIVSSGSEESDQMKLTAEHFIFVQLPTFQEECRNEYRELLQNRSDPEKGFSLSPWNFSAMIPEPELLDKWKFSTEECSRILRKVQLLSNIASTDLEVNFALSQFQQYKDTMLVGFPRNVSIVRRPNVTEYLNRTFVKSRERERFCTSASCMTAYHTVTLLADDNFKQTNGLELAYSFLNKTLSKDFDPTRTAHLGIPTLLQAAEDDVIKTMAIQPKGETDEYDYSPETKIFTANTILPPLGLKKVASSLRPKSIAYEAVRLALEETLEKIYESSVSLYYKRQTGKLAKVKEVEIDVRDFQPTSVAESFSDEDRIIAYLIIKVSGQNLDTLDFRELNAFFDEAKRTVGSTEVYFTRFANSVMNIEVIGHDKRYVCHKFNGSVAKDGTNVQDVSKCSKHASCSEVSLTANTTRFDCRCNPGFIGNGTLCVYKAELCEANLHGCHVYAKCENAKNGYQCLCLEGFSGDGYECTDIDECKTSRYPCDSNAACRNSVGSYTCVCNDGYVGNGAFCTGTALFYGTVPLNSFFTFSMKLTNTSSNEYKSLANAVSDDLTNLYQLGSDYNVTALVSSFFKGSVIAEYIVIVTGENASDLTSDKLNQTFADAVLLRGKTFSIIHALPTVTHPLKVNDAKMLLTHRNRTDVISRIVKPEQVQLESFCFSAYVRLDQTVVEFYNKNSSTAVDNFNKAGTPLRNKVERDLFDFYSSRLPHLLSVKTTEFIKARPTSFKSLLQNPQTWPGEDVVEFGVTVQLSTSFNASDELLNEHRFIGQIEEELVRSYMFYWKDFECLSMNKQSDPVNGSVDEIYSACSCDGFRLAVRVTDLTKVLGTIASSSGANLTFLAKHVVIVALTQLNDSCKAILKEPTSYAGYTDYFSISEKPDMNLKPFWQNDTLKLCLQQLTQVVAERNLTAFNLAKSFYNALSNNRFNNSAKPFAGRFVANASSIRVSVADTKFELFQNRTLSMSGAAGAKSWKTDLIVQHVVIATRRKTSDANILGDLWRAKSNLSEPNFTAIRGLPFDVRLTTSGSRSREYRNAGGKDKRVSLSKVKDLLTEVNITLPSFVENVSQFPLNMSGDSADVRNSTAKESLKANMRKALKILMMARSDSDYTVAETLAALNQLSSPALSLLSSIISTVDNQTKLSLDKEKENALKVKISEVL